VELLTPLQVGPRNARNRILFGPHETNLGRGRSFSEQHTAYYRRRAAGGAGIIVTEEASVHDSDWPYERAPLAALAADGWAAVAEACHAEGALVLAALGHAGGQGTSHWSQRELWAPSRVPEVNTREVPKWMEAEDIGAVIAGFAAAAGAAVAAGCDGVEINAGQYSLVRQFLSGLTNLRDDEWGQDRTRFARDVLTAVRQAVGPDAVVALRLSADELAPWAGLTPELATEVAAQLASQCDLLTVVRGSIFSVAATRPDGHTAPGFNLDLAQQVRAVVQVPIVAQGSLVEWGQAEWAVSEGDRCDAVEMTRALIADPDLPAKLAAGEPERIRPCVLCNQTCQVRDNRNPRLTCVVNPSSGHELDEPEPTGVAAAAGRIVVVGGGVAGMEAARVAAARGHGVTVLERSAQLGGVVRSAAAGSGRDRFGLFADWLEAETTRLGVQVQLGATDSETAAALAAATAVVVATGGVPGLREYEIDPAATVLSAAEALDGAVPPAGVALVWDPIGGPIGVSVAETLVAAGRSVELATPDNIVGNELSRSGDLAAANARLQQAGVVLHRRSLLRAVTAEGVVLEDRFSGERRTVAAAFVVDAGHRLPDTTYYSQLADQLADLSDDQLPTDTVVRVGDCVAPRTVHEAVLEARRAVLAIEGWGDLSDGVPMGRPH
jgi:2,4-dienoyl-CoA reductase (NADPH2)